MGNEQDLADELVEQALTRAQAGGLRSWTQGDQTQTFEPMKDQLEAAILAKQLANLGSGPVFSLAERTDV